MAALWNRADHYSFALWFLSFFLAESQHLQIGCLPYFHIWCGLSANLECMSEMCCMWLAGNTGPIWVPSQLCRAISQQTSPHMSSQYGELWPTNGWDPFGSLGHPNKFQRVSRLGTFTERHSSRPSGRQPNCGVEQTAHCHLYSARRPSRWALAHILVLTWNHVWNKIKFFTRDSMLTFWKYLKDF